MTVRFRILVATLLLIGATVALAQLSTGDHVAEPGFWPTKAQGASAGFLGDAACARCHAGIAETQQMTSMARTATAASAASILHQHPNLGFKFDRDLYRIQGEHTNRGWAAEYSVSDGTRELSFPLLWAFGTGRVGQSYLFKKDDDHFYEARVTYFKSLSNLGFTPARTLSGPVELQEAMSREVSESELIRCFSCHATAVNASTSFDEKTLIPGVQCEACHGPGVGHVQLMQSKTGAAQPETEDLGTFSPVHLSPTDSVEFCGACHGSWWDVKLAHVTGPSTVRSAPYRLVTSKCWGKEGDPRLVCSACHDPHRELVTDARAYDSACLRCHAASAGGHSSAPESPATRGHLPGCPVASASCTNCHMPKVYVPEMHDNFTDHRIRIARTGEPFPE